MGKLFGYDAPRLANRVPEVFEVERDFFEGVLAGLQASGRAAGILPMTDTESAGVMVHRVTMGLRTYGNPSRFP